MIRVTTHLRASLVLVKLRSVFRLPKGGFMLPVFQSLSVDQIIAAWLEAGKGIIGSQYRRVLFVV
jgi:hypothetical protein